MGTDEVSPDGTAGRAGDPTPPVDRPPGPAIDGRGSGRPGPPPIPARYAAIGIGDGAVAIYDRDDAEAWIQSDRPVPLSGAGAGGPVDG